MEAEAGSPKKRARWPQGSLKISAGSGCRFSLLLWKPHQKKLDYLSVVPKMAEVTRQHRVWAQSLGAHESVRRVVRCAQLREQLGTKRVSNLIYAPTQKTSPEDVVKAVRELTVDAFETQVLGAKLTQQTARIPYQRALITGYNHLRQTRAAYEQSKKLHEMAGVIGAGTTLRWPVDFNALALQNLKGTVWSADSRSSVTVSFADYVETSLHLQASCVMCGPVLATLLCTCFPKPPQRQRYRKLGLGVQRFVPLHSFPKDGPDKSFEHFQEPYLNGVLSKTL